MTGTVPFAMHSDRETVVLRLVARGKTSPEIASILGISAKTVENHRQNLKDKLDIHDVAGLTLYALRTGLIVPD
ncbi:MAG: LuxR C-terminal-related transcriptional regulator [Pseudomonadota bacterium]